MSKLAVGNTFAHELVCERESICMGNAAVVHIRVGHSLFRSSLCRSFKKSDESESLMWLYTKRATRAICSFKKSERSYCSFWLKKKSDSLSVFLLDQFIWINKRVIKEQEEQFALYCSLRSFKNSGQSKSLLPLFTKRANT